MASEVLREAMGLWSRGDRAAALALSASQLEAQPDNEELVVFHSGLLLHQSEFEQARVLLEAAAPQSPESARLRVNLSIARRACGDLDGSVEAAKRAVEMAPDLLSGWNALGIGLIEMNRLDEAAQRLRDGLSRHPESVPLLHHLDQVMARQGKTQGAERDQSLALLVQAEAMVKGGNAVAAETLLRQAVKLYPDRSGAHASLAVFLMQFGRNTEAAESFRAALQRNPSCPTSGYLLQVVEGSVPDSGSTGYVQSLFDSYAERFDQHLLEELEYKVPELLAERLRPSAGESGLGEVLDLGCGTGLMGARLEGQARAIDGVDLSAKMLDKARVRGLYRTLVEADIREYLATGSSRWSIIVAADVFCYCGRLEDIFELVLDRLEAGGVLAFTVESSDDKEVEVLTATGRYRHGLEYLERALAAAGFGHCEIDTAVLRKNQGAEVEGFVVLARP